jgi:pyruvate/2-oxoglutarate dehydrogenase complex dihydrolipoamide dehydrogenase (E3) component
MADHSRPDLCVIGAGALGIALAKHARALGASVTLVDRGASEPGDGPQQTLSLAALQASAARAHAVRQASAFGVAGAEPKVSMKAVQERAASLAAEQAPVTDRDRLSALGIEMIGGAVTFVDQNSLMVGDLQIRPRAIILAIGGSPTVPAVPGLDQIKYFTPDTILGNRRKLTHLLVIGGTAAALGLAQAFARLGSAVSLVPQGPVLPDCDPELVSILLDALAGEGVHMLDGASLAEIIPRAQGTGALVSLANGGQEALDVSHVLLAAGTHADIEALGAAKARLRFPKGQGNHFATGPLGETSNRRIRVTGAAAGIDQWQNAIAHGRAVVETLVLSAPVEKPAPGPVLVPTEPALAQVGRLPKPEKTLRAGHHLLRASLVENEQARALGQAQGLAKVLLAPDGKVAGAGFVGPGAAEMAAFMALAMENHIALDRLARLSLPHPSLLASVTALSEAAAATRTVSPWALRLRAARQRLSFRQR